MPEFDYDYYGFGSGEFTFDDSKSESTINPLNLGITSVYGVISIVGLLANGVVLFVLVAGNEIGKTVTAKYILQLTIADTIFLFTLPVFALQKIIKSWSFGSGLCALCQTIKFFNYYAGIFFLMVMSVDRYVAVAYSTKSTKLRTARRTQIISVCVWVCAGLMSLPIMIFARTEETLDQNAVYCKLLFPRRESEAISTSSSHNVGTSVNYMYSDDEQGLVELNDTMLGDYDPYYYTYGNDVEGQFEIPPKTFTCNHGNKPQSYKTWLIINFVIGFVLPFVVIVVSYVKIIWHLQLAEQKLVHSSSNRSVKMRRRVTRMVAALVIGFTFCWLPHHVYNLIRIRGFISGVTLCYTVDEILVALAFSNSALNPILYSFLGNSFGERLKGAAASLQRKLSNRHRSSHPAFSNGLSSQDNSVVAKKIAKYRRQSRGSNVTLATTKQEMKTFNVRYEKGTRQQTKTTEII